MVIGHAEDFQTVRKGDRGDMQASNSIVNASSSIASMNSSFENNVVVEQWKANIDKHFSIEKKSLSSSSAALMIQNLFRSFRHRKTFKNIKAVLAQAEETITKKVLQQINPSEAHLVNDPSLRARVRFRLGGSTWPPVVLYKIYTSVPFQYIDGKVVTANYAGKIENQDVYTRREYQKFISCLDKEPIRTGGRGNFWRPLFRSRNLHESSSTSTRQPYDSWERRNQPFPAKMRAAVIETRFGAGGGIVGPGRTKLSHGTTRVKHPRSPVNARWLSSIPVPSSRRPGTTTDAGRRILRRAKNGNSRTPKRPKSAGVSRRRSKKNGVSSGNRSVSFNSGVGRRKLGRKTSSSSRSLLLNGKEMARKSLGTSKMQKAPSKVLTPTRYKNHVNKGTVNLGSQSRKKKSSGSTRKNLAHSLTSWETVPESEVNDLYAWSTALNIDQDLEKLLWVKTSPS